MRYYTKRVMYFKGSNCGLVLSRTIAPYYTKCLVTIKSDVEVAGAETFDLLFNYYYRAEMVSVKVLEINLDETEIDPEKVYTEERR